jgi:hypothetical protein
MNYVTWNPGIKGSILPGTFVYAIRRGLYMDIGRFIFLHIHLVVSSFTGNPYGKLQITGSPFSPVYETPLTLGITSYMGVDLNQRYIMPIINTNSLIEFLSCGSGPEAAINVNTVANNATIQICGSFIASD